MGHSTSGFTSGNNVLTGTAGTLEAIRETNSRFDFGIKWAGGVDGTAAVSVVPNQPSVGLVRGTFPMHPDFGAQAYQNGTSWDAGDAVISVDWADGTLGGTIKEKYYVCTFDSGGVVVSRSLAATRDNIDPGYGDIGTNRPGQRYSFVITGTEFRIYNSREESAVVVLASPPQGVGFPLSLGAWAGIGFNTVDIRIARVRQHDFSTIYSARDRTADSVSSGLHVRIYENPTPPLTVRGVTTDVDI